MCGGTCVHVYGGLKLTSGVFLDPSTLYLLGCSLSLNPELSNFGYSSSPAFPGDLISVSEERTLQVVPTCLIVT